MAYTAIKDKSGLNWSVKWKLMAVMTILMVSLVVILTCIQISSQKKMIEGELNKRISLIKKNLIERGKSLIANLTLQLESNIASYNFSGAIEAIRKVTENNKEIKCAVLVDSGGVTLHTLDSDYIQFRLTETDLRALSLSQMQVVEYKEGNKSVIEVVNPVQISTEPWGIIKLIYTLEHIDREIEISEKQIRLEISRMIYNSVLVSLEFMGVCFIIVVLLATKFSTPLIHLTHSARKLSKGDFSVSSDIRVRSGDEVGVLAEAFIEMSKELRTSYEKLEEYSRTLEQRVAERTEELDQKNIRLNKALLEVDAARKDAEMANQIKSDFLANISHEIRTPMNAIIGMTSLALNTEMAPTMRTYLNTVQTSAHSLLELINDILDFSKIEADKLDLEFVDFQLHDVMNNLADMFAGKAVEKGIELIIFIERDVPCALVGDPLRLRQILINLTNNAVKFTESGEISIKADLPEGQHSEISDPLLQNTVSGQETTDKFVLRFSVSDTGLGIPVDKLPELFMPFTQVDSSFTRKFGGTGLGLSISKRLVEMMGGDIWAESEQERGSSFHFTVRLGRQSEDREQKQMLPAELHEMKVLVADSNETLRKNLQRILTSFSFKVTLAESADMALYESCDLAIIGCNILGSDVTDVLKRIRENPESAGIPIIIMIDFGKEKLAQKAREAGVNYIITKPVKQSSLFDAIMEALGQKNAEVYETEDAADTEDEIAEKIRGIRILLVEDNLLNQQVAKALLNDAGVTVELADNGREAIERLITDDNRLMSEPDRQSVISYQSCDAVLMDIQMPEMDGFEATKAIREYEARKNGSAHHIPIIAMTAHAMKGDREKCIEAGMDDYITKPIDFEQLYSVLARWAVPEDNKPELENQDSGLEKQDLSPEKQDLDAESWIPDSLPGIDIESFLKRLGGNKKLFRKLLEEFFRDYSEAAPALRNALKDNDTELALLLTHTLKGVAGNFSAQELHKAAMDLEREIRNNNADDLDNLLDSFECALACVLESIKAMEEDIDKSGTRSSVAEISNTESSEPSIGSLLAKLADLIRENNVGAEPFLNSLKTHLGDFEVQEQIKELEAQIAMFDFKSAKKTLAEIAEIIGGG